MANASPLQNDPTLVTGCRCRPGDDHRAAAETAGPILVPCPVGQADPQGVLWGTA